MPLRFPHGLIKDPTKMTRAELSIVGALVGSVGVGIYQLATSPWGPGSETTRDASTTKMAQTLEPKGVEDGVTKIQFGARQSRP